VEESKTQQPDSERWMRRGDILSERELSGKQARKVNGSLYHLFSHVSAQLYLYLVKIYHVNTHIIPNK
jgi:hypothetical protein